MLRTADAGERLRFGSSYRRAHRTSYDSFDGTTRRRLQRRKPAEPVQSMQSSQLVVPVNSGEQGRTVRTVAGLIVRLRRKRLMHAALDVMEQRRLEITRDRRGPAATALAVFFERLSGSKRTCSETRCAET